jgi:hypothetical protein
MVDCRGLFGWHPIWSGGTKYFPDHFFEQEALMDRPKIRNEFGLDRDNALDVQKERTKPMLPWALGLMLVLIMAGGLIYAFSMGPNNHTRPSAAQQPPLTTGSR